MESELAKMIKNFDRETLEKKFISLMSKVEELQNNENKDGVDFNNFKNVRRMQYLNKTYTKNATALNKMLKIMKETDDINLKRFFNKLYKELDKNESGDK